MQVKESFLRDTSRLVVWYPLRWLIEIMPVSTGLGLLEKMGDVHYLLSHGGRSLRGNLDYIKGIPLDEEKEKQNIIREYLKNHYINTLFILISPKLDPANIDKLMDIEGREYLDEALEMGKGVILVHGHFGPAHLPLSALAVLGYNIKQIGLPSGDGLSWIGKKVAFRLRGKYEAKLPEIIKADTFMRPAFRWLNDNGILMIPGDGTGTDKRIGRYESFRFLGRQVMFPMGPAILANKAKSSILPLFVVPGRKKLYKIIIEKPLSISCNGRERIVTDQFIRRLEYYSNRYLGYMHFLDVFNKLVVINADD